ncbi:redox-active disulfide protein 2 [Candidatus Uhrbacteria bacterium RIFCSPLOWO2_02_FULL_49_11]|uniref:Redox-active disulfide protein 2 n=1 Tax=Candidatus Uhrbacteria bacterium RIFCSPLOWO2_02_FULL_49_11 TaxID=1802409 RepID=A0A1F7VCC7_9BACT|nr:MAG: redox-active disulfide protein 2 [Candidatus Uhrbacteria bacterium RIFCSPLOWO2_02_FULL_49_11]
MNIQVIGTGCPTCKTLLERTKEAVKLLGVSAEIEYITDVERIVAMGIMHSPVLVIDEKPVLVGSLPSIDKIKDLIQQAG